MAIQIAIEDRPNYRVRDRRGPSAQAEQSGEAVALISFS
jgi:hypothetical protein